MLDDVTTTLVSRFEEVRLGDAASVGGKGANLGEMTAAGLPIPPGFVVTAEAYLHAVEGGGIGSGFATVSVPPRRRSTTPRRCRARPPNSGG